MFQISEKLGSHKGLSQRPQWPLLLLQRRTHCSSPGSQGVERPPFVLACSQKQSSHRSISWTSVETPTPCIMDGFVPSQLENPKGTPPSRPNSREKKMKTFFLNFEINLPQLTGFHPPPGFFGSEVLPAVPLLVGLNS